VSLLCKLLEAQSLCRQMQGNMGENMVDVMATLYHRLGLQWNDDIRTEVRSHTEGSADQDKDIYKTVRSKNYVGNNWEQNLSEAQVNLIERDCSEFMLKAGYHFKNHKRPKQENEEKEEQKENETDSERENKEKEVTNGYGHDEGYSYST